VNKKQYQQLLRTAKPLHRAPTLFGMTHREFVLALVAVGAVLVAILK
jgi:hypothetical protein